LDIANEILDAIEIIVDKKIRDNTAQIYSGVCKSIKTSTCVMSINGKNNTVQYYGGQPILGAVYRVFVPNGNMSNGFVIVPGDKGDTPIETGDYNKLINLPSINDVELKGNKTTSDIEGLQTDVGALKTDVGQVKTALNSKQDTITGGASTITDNNLTANRALVSNGSGKVVVSEVTSTELGYLDGVTSKVQTQLDGKQGVNDEIQAVRLRGGINSIINNTDAVSINPAINAVGFLRYNGGNVQIFYDGYLMPFSNADIDTLFDGKFSTYINFGSGPSHAQTVCSWSETTNYPQNARVMYQTASGVFRWYKALKESQGVIPEGDSTGAWEDVSTTYNTSLMDVKNLEVSIVIDSHLVLKWENGVSFYWRTARQNCGYYKIEVYDSVADQYVFVAERDNIPFDEVVNTQYMGVRVNGTGKRFRITFRALPTQEYGWLAVTQIAFTGVSGGIEGTLVNRGGSTMYGDLSPYTNGGASLGTSSAQWKEVRAQNIHGNINDTTSTFSQATSRTNISSGDKLSTIFGKIAKWFSDLGGLAFKSSVAKSDLSSDVQESLNKADSALQSAPVTSVNTKIGAVVLTKSDIDLSNVDNVKQYSASNPPPYPVTSVNGQTGDVTVKADIPDNLVKYTTVSDVQSVDGLNADTLEGHNAAFSCLSFKFSANLARPL
jgi:hypothetical protein